MSSASWSSVPPEWRHDEILRTMIRRNSPLAPLHMGMGAAHRPGIACVVQTLARVIGTLLVLAAVAVAVWPLAPELAESATGDALYAISAQCGRLYMTGGLLVSGLLLATPRLWWWGGRQRPDGGTHPGTTS